MHSKIVNAVKLIGGSWFVFASVVVVGQACSSGSGPNVDADLTGGGQRAGAGGSRATGGGRGGNGMVPDANADESGSRLQAAVVKGADGSVHAMGTFHDSMLNEDCAFVATSGAYQCVPILPATLNTFFSDSGCKTPLATLVTTSCSSQPSTQFAYVPDESPGSCGGAYKRLTGAYAGPFYSDVSGPCVKEGTAAATDAMYTVGADVPRATFVGGTRATM